MVYIRKIKNVTRTVDVKYKTILKKVETKHTTTLTITGPDFVVATNGDSGGRKTCENGVNRQWCAIDNAILKSLKKNIKPGNIVQIITNLKAEIKSKKLTPETKKKKEAELKLAINIQKKNLKKTSIKNQTSLDAYLLYYGITVVAKNEKGNSVKVNIPTYSKFKF